MTRSVRGFSVFLLAVSFGGLLLFGVPQAAMAVVAICPAIGADTASPFCGVLIGIGTGGALSVSATGQPAYDSVEDTLIGITNNTTGPVSSVTLTGSVGSGIFGFDGDGICTFAPYTPASASAYCSSLPVGANGYEGPNNTFTGISLSGDSGTVHFTTALAAGASTFFSLEGTPGAVAGGLGGVPEPSTVVLLGSALVGCAGLKRRIIG